MLGYIYKTTNLINNKIYIGQHSKQDCSMNTLDESYYGSGIKITNALNKYGKDNFSVEILCWCNTYEDLNDMERFYIKEYDSTNNNIGYNIAEGGSFGNSVAGKTEEEKELWRQHISEGTKKAMNTSEMHEKLCISSRKNDEWKKHLSEANKGKHLSEETKEKLRKASTGKKHSLETIQLLREINTGENNPMYGKHLSNEAKEKISKGAKKVVHTDEWNKKVGDALRGKKRTEEQKEKMRKPKKKYKFLLPDGSTIIMSSNNGTRHKDWIKLEEVKDDNLDK